MAQQCQELPRTILKRKKVEAVTGLSRSGIYDRLDSKSPRHDPDFPQPVRLGQSSVGWYSDLVQIWIDTRPLAKASA